MRGFGALLSLEMLDEAMGVQGVCDFAAELEVDADADAVGGHEGLVHVHFLLAVAVARLFVPGVFVFAFLTRFGIQLEGHDLDREGHGRGVGTLAEASKGCGVCHRLSVVAVLTHLSLRHRVFLRPLVVLGSDVGGGGGLWWCRYLR
jgi:hypothetical protein